MSMGLYDENGIFLAGAEIDPDTLELEREIAPYNVDAIAGQNEPAQQSATTPFYGIWCYGGKSEEDADAYAQSMRSSGYDAQVFVTTDWSNLNPEKFYVVTAGISVRKRGKCSIGFRAEFLCRCLCEVFRRFPGMRLQR